MDARQEARGMDGRHEAKVFGLSITALYVFLLLIGLTSA